MIRIRLRHAAVDITEELVRCAFADGTYADCDITRSHGPGYRGTAHFWGYDDHVRYAQHHDLFHCWLWGELYDAPSPTLWAVAHDLPPPPENRFEEHLVNHVQYTLAQDSGEFDGFLREHIGDGWRGTLGRLRDLVADVGLPVPVPA